MLATTKDFFTGFIVIVVALLRRQSTRSPSPKSRRNDDELIRPRRRVDARRERSRLSDIPSCVDASTALRRVRSGDHPAALHSRRILLQATTRAAPAAKAGQVV